MSAPLKLTMYVFTKEKYNLKSTMKDQSWADHAVALLCWDVIMNQWSTVFHLSFYILLRFQFIHTVI